MLKLGVQSYCFRKFRDNRTVARMTRECGLESIELCAVHCDFGDPRGFDETIAAYREAGVEICSIGVQGLDGEIEKEKHYFDFLDRAGVGLMSVSFSPDTVPAAYRAAEALAKEHRVRLAIHNHGARDWLGSARMLDHVLRNTSPEIGFCLDTGWALDSREEPAEMAEKFRSRLYGVHLKDFIFDRSGRPEDVILGEGNLDLEKLLLALGKISFSGDAIIEYEGDADDPVPALGKCAAAFRAALERAAAR